MNRDLAEEKLKKLFGFEKFHDLQWEVIEKLIDGKRVLFIEKTGFGKSLCFQFTSTLFDGVTIVFSPLIALMRDQVRSMKEKGIRVATINSNQDDFENLIVINEAQNNKLDLLYIAPERMENAEWISSAEKMKIGMVVIDEAHCISIWGQSFRPNYRRIVNLINLLPKNFPVLATTATATPRVQVDIIEQIGSDLVCIRGQLIRPNIKLSVIEVQSEDEKYIWIAENLPKLKKSGIIYTGTQANTDIYSNWIQFIGLNSTAYSGRLDADTRKRIEVEFIQNKFDCVVSTNALGMGIDKPDIRFIIHTQIPQSPIHYYQEIGRAGRNGEEAFAILLYNPNEDHNLPKAFIEGSKPSRYNYEKVIAVTKKALLGKHEIIKETNLKQTHVNVILADLIDQAIINEQQGKVKKYFFNPNSKELNLTAFDELRKSQYEELEEMIKYTNIKTCRMKYLCNYLGDYKHSNCGVCDNDLNLQLNIVQSDLMLEKLKEFRETFFPILEVEMKSSKMIDGVAGSYYGVSNVGAAIRYSKYGGGGDFPDWLLKLTLKAFGKNFGNYNFDLILYIPPTESGDLVQKFAEKISTVLKIPISHKLTKVNLNSPQKVFQSGISKKDNVKNNFTYSDIEEIRNKKILLIDDIFDSGYTMKEAGKYLSLLGAELIVPLVIAKTVGGDLN